MAIDDPRAAQLVTSNKIEDYLPATPEQAVDQAHGMILAGLIESGRENDAGARIEAALQLQETAAAYVGVVARAHGIPKANPANEHTATHVTTCLTCDQELTKVPGGNGMVWVHTATQFRFCTERKGS